MDKITRNFTVDRNGIEKEYPFTTFSDILEIIELPKNNKEKLLVYMRSVFLFGIKSEAEKTVTQFPKLKIKAEKYEPKSEFDLSILYLTQSCGWEGKGNRQHDIVQNRFLDMDGWTIATELPVWDDEMTGRIDIVRIKDDDTIQIIDFKPGAFSDKGAPSQLYRYRKLLSLRTGIPSKNIEVLYFDSDHLMKIIL